MSNDPIFGVFVFGIVVGAVLGVGAWELAQYLGAHVSISWGAS